MGQPAEVIRAFFERSNAHDTAGLLALCDPEIEFSDIPEMPDSTTYRGRDGVGAWFAKVFEISDDLRFQIGELEEHRDAVLIETGAEMHGRSSGAGVGWHFWTVWRVREGLITYHHGYTQRSDALEDFNRG